MAERQSSLIRRAIRRALAASGIVAAVLYSWWQTIEAARTPPGLPEARMGEALALGRIALTPVSLHWRAAPAASSDARPLLVLSATAENVTGETQYAPFGHPTRLVAVDAGDAELPPPDIMLLRDRTPLMQLQPRMPEGVEIAWRMPQGWRPEALSLTFFKQQFKLKDNLYGRSNWLGYSAAARMAATPQAPP